jgi:hypothetical protein
MGDTVSGETPPSTVNGDTPVVVVVIHTGLLEKSILGLVHGTISIKGL